MTLTFRPVSNAIVNGSITVVSSTDASPDTVGLVGKGPGGFPTPTEAR